MKKENFIIGSLVVFWLTVLFFTFETKSRAGYAGIPIVAAVLVGYLIWVSLKGVKSTNQTKSDTKKENE
jgi:xanthine/uracil permease